MFFDRNLHYRLRLDKLERAADEADLPQQHDPGEASVAHAAEMERWTPAERAFYDDLDRRIQSVSDGRQVFDQMSDDDLDRAAELYRRLVLAEAEHDATA